MSAVGSNGHPAAGFTLVELLVVFAVLALLTGLATPWFAGVADAVEFRMAARALAADLQDARGLARRSGQPVAIAFDPAGRTYGVPGTTRQVVLPESLSLRFVGSGIATDPRLLGFFPDGTSTGGELWMAGPRQAAGIAIDPFTARFASVAGNRP